MAKAAHAARTAPDYGILGIDASAVKADMAAVSAHVQGRIDAVRPVQEYKETMKEIVLRTPLESLN